ncbi:Sec34-like family-domain-containing protein, partial [Piptocephalis cylindrospora]
MSESPQTVPSPKDTLDAPATTKDGPDALMRWLRIEEDEAHQWSRQPFRRECEKMEEARGLCAQTTQDLAVLQQALAQVEATYQVLETHTSGVRSSCEPWMEKEAHLSELVKALEETISWFDLAEKAGALFDQPDPSMVTHSDFLPMVHRVQEAIAFLNAHPQYLDTPRYKSRFYQCQRKAAITIQRYILQQWSGVEEEWRAGKDKSSFTTQHVRLRSLVNEIQPMVKVLESLALDDPKERIFPKECAAQ